MTNSIRQTFPVLLPAVLAVLISACTPQESDTSTSSDNFTFDTSLSMADFMTMVLEPSADSLWDNAGWVESAAGYEELYPTTDEGWDFVRAQSALIAEAGNLLALPGRAVDNEAWLVYSEGIIDAGRMAMDAAERRHQEDFFQAGAQLYSVCSACHQAYNPDILSRFVQD